MKCGKLTYPSRQAAKRALERVIAYRGGDGRVERRFYYCTGCAGYHLTSLPEAPR